MLNYYLAIRLSPTVLQEAMTSAFGKDKYLALSQAGSYFKEKQQEWTHPFQLFLTGSFARKLLLQHFFKIEAPASDIDCRIARLSLPDEDVSSEFFTQVKALFRNFYQAQTGNENPTKEQLKIYADWMSFTHQEIDFSLSYQEAAAFMMSSVHPLITMTGEVYFSSEKAYQQFLAKEIEIPSWRMLMQEKLSFVSLETSIAAITSDETMTPQEKAKALYQLRMDAFEVKTRRTRVGHFIYTVMSMINAAGFTWKNRIPNEREKLLKKIFNDFLINKHKNINLLDDFIRFLNADLNETIVEKEDASSNASISDGSDQQTPAPIFEDNFDDFVDKLDIFIKSSENLDILSQNKLLIASIDQVLKAIEYSYETIDEGKLNEFSNIMNHDIWKKHRIVINGVKWFVQYWNEKLHPPAAKELSDIEEKPIAHKDTPVLAASDPHVLENINVPENAMSDEIDISLCCIYTPNYPKVQIALSISAFAFIMNQIPIFNENVVQITSIFFCTALFNLDKHLKEEAKLKFAQEMLAFEINPSWDKRQFIKMIHVLRSTPKCHIKMLTGNNPKTKFLRQIIIIYAVIAKHFNIQGELRINDNGEGILSALEKKYQTLQHAADQKDLFLTSESHIPDGVNMTILSLSDAGAFYQAAYDKNNRTLERKKQLHLGVKYHHVDSSFNIDSRYMLAFLVSTALAYVLGCYIKRETNVSDERAFFTAFCMLIVPTSLFLFRENYKNKNRLVMSQALNVNYFLRLHEITQDSLQKGLKPNDQNPKVQFLGKVQRIGTLINQAKNAPRMNQQQLRELLDAIEKCYGSLEKAMNADFLFLSGIYKISSKANISDAERQRIRLNNHWYDRIYQLATGDEEKFFNTLLKTAADHSVAEIYLQAFYGEAVRKPSDKLKLTKD